jgi:hypothetical protein
MQIEIVRTYPLSELISRLRGLTMLQDRNAFPYKDAKINATNTVLAEVLSPCQLYVLASEYEKVHRLRHFMLIQHGIDILQLGKTMVGGVGGERQEALGFVEYRVDGGETITILPPIIEHSLEVDNRKCLLINDGMHRCYLSLVSRITPHVIVVDDVPKELPYYAWPLPGGWRDVKIVHDISEIPLKKFHRVPHPAYKALYRDFNSVFQNVGGPRGK